MADGIPRSGGVNPWAWPPVFCTNERDGGNIEDWYLAIEVIETDPDSY